MRLTMGCLVLLCLPGTGLAQLTAADEAQARALAGGFRGDSSQARIDGVAEILRRAREGSPSGMAGLGFFPGTLLPITAPVPLTAAPSVAARCRTTYRSSIPGAGPPEGDDRVELRRRPDGWVDVVFDGRDVQGRLRLELRSDGREYLLTRVLIDDDLGQLDLSPVQGGLRDKNTGELIAESTQDYRDFMTVVEAVVRNNPSWFIESGQVVLGQTWIGSDEPDEALRSAAAILGAMTGGTSTMGDFAYAGGATGLTAEGGQQGLVFEFIARAPLMLPGRPPIEMALSGYEVYDLASLFRVTSIYALDMVIDGRPISVEQQQVCSLD
ncbi:MAG: hypothetical protein LCH92_14900 [Proteobacteria bacterium]|nr:hypothetical protein [Pseudomonadota bacterium]